MPIFGQPAPSLQTTNDPVDVGSAAPPSAGQVLTATSATAAAWQTPTGSGTTRQSIYQQLAVDTTTTSGAFVDLLTQAITTTAGGFLNAFFSVSASNVSGDQLSFRLLVDGVAVQGTACKIPTSGTTANAMLLYKASIAAGAHTIKVQWLTSGGNTARIRPVAAPSTEHASLLLTETSI